MALLPGLEQESLDVGKLNETVHERKPFEKLRSEEIRAFERCDGGDLSVK
jgi:hypothetical protein